MSMLRLPSLEPISSKSKKRREGRERKKVHKKEKLIIKIKIKIQIKTELTVSSCRSIACLVFTLNDKTEGGIANWENGGKTGRTGRNQKRRRREIQKKKKKKKGRKTQPVHRDGDFITLSLLFSSLFKGRKCWSVRRGGFSVVK